MDDEDASRILVNIIEDYPERIIELANERIQVRHLLFKSYLYGKHQDRQEREYLSKKQAQMLDDKWSEIFES